MEPFFLKDFPLSIYIFFNLCRQFIVKELLWWKEYITRVLLCQSWRNSRCPMILLNLCKTFHLNIIPIQSFSKSTCLHGHMFVMLTFFFHMFVMPPLRALEERWVHVVWSIIVSSANNQIIDGYQTVCFCFLKIF